MSRIEDKPTWQVVVGVFVCATIISLMITGLSALVSQSDGAVVSTRNSEVEAQSPTSDIDPTLFKRKFNRGKYGTAQGTKVPKRWRNMMNAKPRAAGLGDWWNDRLSEASCFFHTKIRNGRTWECLPNTARQIDSVNKKITNTTKVITKCGARGILGYYTYKAIVERDTNRDGFKESVRVTRKGWLGVAAYTTDCTIGAMFDRWW